MRFFVPFLVLTSTFCSVLIYTAALPESTPFYEIELVCRILQNWNNDNYQPSLLPSLFVKARKLAMNDLDFVPLTKEELADQVKLVTFTAKVDTEKQVLTGSLQELLQKDAYNLKQNNKTPKNVAYETYPNLINEQQEKIVPFLAKHKDEVLAIGVGLGKDGVVVLLKMALEADVVVNEIKRNLRGANKISFSKYSNLELNHEAMNYVNGEPTGDAPTLLFEVDISQITKVEVHSTTPYIEQSDDTIKGMDSVIQELKSVLEKRQPAKEGNPTANQKEDAPTPAGNKPSMVHGRVVQKTENDGTPDEEKKYLKCRLMEVKSRVGTSTGAQRIVFLTTVQHGEEAATAGEFAKILVQHEKTKDYFDTKEVVYAGFASSTIEGGKATKLAIIIPYASPEERILFDLKDLLGLQQQIKLDIKDAERESLRKTAHALGAYWRGAATVSPVDWEGLVFDLPTLLKTNIYARGSIILGERANNTYTRMKKCVTDNIIGDDEVAAEKIVAEWTAKLGSATAISIGFAEQSQKEKVDGKEKTGEKYWNLYIKVN